MVFRPDDNDDLDDLVLTKTKKKKGRRRHRHRRVWISSRKTNTRKKSTKP